MRSTRSAVLGLTAALLLIASGVLPGQQDEKKPAYLKILVPADAELEIEGYKTKSTGDTRLFVSPPLVPGKNYHYTIKITFADGRHVTHLHVAPLLAGRETLADLRKLDGSSQIIFVPTADEVVDDMLKLAEITKKDVVYDLGCGDGRIVIRAAKKYGAKGVGVDIDPDRVKEARENAKKEGVEDLVEIRHGDALRVEDLDKATAVLLYMLPEFMHKLEPYAKEKLKPGARVVAHDYPFKEWKYDKVFESKGPFRSHTLYLWKVEK